MNPCARYHETGSKKVKKGKKERKKCRKRSTLQGVVAVERCWLEPLCQRAYAESGVELLKGCPFCWLSQKSGLVTVPASIEPGGKSCPDLGSSSFFIFATRHAQCVFKCNCAAKRKRKRDDAKKEGKTEKKESGCDTARSLYGLACSAARCLEVFDLFCYPLRQKESRKE